MPSVYEKNVSIHCSEAVKCDGNYIVLKFKEL